MTSPALAERFHAAAAQEPLSALGPGARAELDAVLARVEAFEDLPGKWQAALLQAEAPGDAGASHGHCCH